MPVKYCRLNIDNEQELVLFEKAVRTFTFNVEDDDEPEKKKMKGNSFPAVTGPSEASTSSTQKEVLEVLELLDDEQESQNFL